MDDTHRIYHFLRSDGGGERRIDGLGEEYVVISEGSTNEVVGEYVEPGFYLDKVLDIDGDATSFPCDRILTAG